MSLLSFPKPSYTLGKLVKLALRFSLIGLVFLYQGTLVPSQAAPPRQKPDTTALSAAAVTPTNEWAVQLAPGVEPNRVAAQYGFQNLGQIGTLENFYLFRRPAGRVGSADVQGLESTPGVLWLEQQVARQQYSRVIPTDPLYGNQWHLHNTGQSGGEPGQDVNIIPVWNSNITGSGVLVGVVDDGLQHTHPDFSGKYVPAASYDFNDNDSNPAPNPSFDFHGTAAAGVAVAGNEGSCGVGSAFGAQVAGLRLIAAPSTDAKEATALTYQFQLNDIYSNSWGPADNGQSLLGPGPLTLAALENGVTSGRGGLGNIYVWAAGNGLGSSDNVNYDGYANSRFTIAVAAVDHGGRQAAYSEPGAAIVVTSPSSGDGVGITTTDLVGANGYEGTNCTSSFGGTSSATPLVSGIIALMLQARPGLSWRDVQHILIKTAAQNDPANSDWRTNGTGYHINHNYGFGRVDAGAAVNSAKTWTPVGPVSKLDSGIIPVNLTIPDDLSTGLTSTFSVNQNIKVEHVEVIFEATHPYRGDLEVVLTSPSGTQSRLATAHSDSGDNYNNWRFMTVRNWGEASGGNWSLKVSDEAALDIGTFKSWRLVLYGTSGSTTPSKFYFPLIYKALALGNGNFESGPTAWTEYSEKGYDLIQTTFSPGVTPHSGVWAAWLGGVFDDIQYIEQKVTIPPATPYLRYWHWIASEDACGYDFGGVLVNNSVVDIYDLCAAANTGGWASHAVNLSGYSGQTVAIQIRAETDNLYNSNLFVDDVQFAGEMTVATALSKGEAVPGAAATLKPGPDALPSETGGTRRFPVAEGRQ